MPTSELFTTPAMGAFALSSVIAYLLGSISFAVIFSKLFAKDDVRNYGSGNAGATNVFRSIGVGAGICTFFCDFGKGALAILCSKWMLALAGIGADKPQNMPVIYVAASISGLFAMLGHLYPVFFSFRGGKGVMTLTGIVFILSPIRGAILFGIFLIVFALTRTVSIGSIIAVALYPVATFVECWLIQRLQEPELYTSVYVTTQVVVAIVFAAIVVFKHSSNIRRMIEGTEPKLTIKQKRETSAK